MPLLRRLLFWLLTPLVMIFLWSAISGGFSYWKTRSEIDALGSGGLPTAQKLETLQDTAVQRVQVMVVIILGSVILVIIFIMSSLTYKVVRRDRLEPSPLSATPARPPPDNPKPAPRPVQEGHRLSVLTRVLLVVNVVVISVYAIQSYTRYVDYRAAREELLILQAAYDDRLKILQDAKTKEQDAINQCRIDDNDIASTPELNVKIKLRALDEAVRTRKFEEVVVARIKRDVDLYAKLVQQAAPWRIIAVAR